MGPAIYSFNMAWVRAFGDATDRAIRNRNTEDAFTAAAVKLAKGGATSKTRAGEIAAAKAYIGGSPNCSQAICNSYANTIQQKAANIEKNL